MERVTGGDAESGLLGQAFQQASFALSVYDPALRCLWLNEIACHQLDEDAESLRGRTLPFGIPDSFDVAGILQAVRNVPLTGRPAHYEAFGRAPGLEREHAWRLELWPVRDGDGAVRAVGMAAFDNSEQHWARERLAVLDRAAVSIGTTLDLGRTAQELAELVVPRFADFVSVDLLEAVIRGDEPDAGPPDAAVVLQRAAHLSSAGSGEGAVIGLGASDRYPPFSPPARALHSGLPVLSGSGDPDFERWMSGAPARAQGMRGHTVTSLLAVPLIARGTTLGVAVLARIRPDRFRQQDVTLARELASRAAVCVDNARRYTRERATALALQRSLLPRGTSRQSAVELACRYLPADSSAGVGGDWFDVIPLSGARVALVVGDVVGHGIQASATMGRLRTAVRTLADVDLQPDELLAHLDDLVLRLAGDFHEDEADEGNGDRTDAGATGATCVYAVYDPVSRRLAAASAGHPPPVLLLPDGATRVLDVAAGPVLGVGGLPFETTETELPEGALVALFSDGLVEARDRDADLGIDALRHALAVPVAGLEQQADHLLAKLLPERPEDDVALVLARTRALGEDRVRVWDLPSDVSVVAEARRLAAAQLDAWGRSAAAFETELVVSELVTNAIRYGTPPIQLRLILPGTPGAATLICEVSDANASSPHLRRARTMDEGGRGLLLVAQLTARWGTRHTSEGKTIWAELTL